MPSAFSLMLPLTRLKRLALVGILLAVPATAVADPSACGHPRSDSDAPPRTLAADIVWRSFSVSAIRTDATDPIQFRVQLASAPTAVQIDLAAGGSVPLTPSGGDLWSATITAGQALFGYASAKVNHNFVGFLRVYEGTAFDRYNLFINVVDASVAPVTPVPLGATLQRGCRVVNLWQPGLVLPTSENQEQQMAQAFYSALGDDFDFLSIVYSLPGFFGNRNHRMVRNDVSGIGVAPFDDSALWGSSGRLRGVTQYPIETFFDLGESATMHELGHQWINFSDFPLLAIGEPHWRPGTQARGVMGVSLFGGVGGDFPYELEPQLNGNVRMVGAPRLGVYTDLDLYLMGLLPPDSVGTNFVFSDPDQPVCHGCEGPVTTFTIADVVTAQGPRIPTTASSSKRFRVGTLVVTRDRLLTADEMAMYEYWAARGEATVELPFTSGFASGTTKPFRLATGGRGWLDTWLNAACAPAAVGPLLHSPHATLRLVGRHPVSRDATFEWEQTSRSHATLDVVSVDGRRVARLEDGVLESGAHRVRWSLESADGARVPAGVYFVSLRLEGRPAAQRALVVVP